MNRITYPRETEFSQTLYLLLLSDILIEYIYQPPLSLFLSLSLTHTHTHVYIYIYIYTYSLSLSLQKIRQHHKQSSYGHILLLVTPSTWMTLCFHILIFGMLFLLLLLFHLLLLLLLLSFTFLLKDTIKTWNNIIMKCWT